MNAEERVNLSNQGILVPMLIWTFIFFIGEWLADGFEIHSNIGYMFWFGDQPGYWGEWFIENNLLSPDTCNEISWFFFGLGFYAWYLWLTFCVLGTFISMIRLVMLKKKHGISVASEF